MSMRTEQAPSSEQALRGDDSATTPWSFALERMENPEKQRTSWLATVRPDGGPHLVPIIAFWIDGALYFVAGQRTQKGRNLAADGRCVIGIGSLKLPSIDLIAEGRAEALADEDEVRRMADHLGSNGWPLEARGAEVYGPHAPTAGPPPYRIYRMVPIRIYGLPGMHGMDEFDQSELPKPTRWDW